MVNTATGATAPTTGNTAASHGSATYLREGKWVRITFPDGAKKTVRTIPKPKNIKKCNLESHADFGNGKTFPHSLWLDLQAKVRNDMTNLLSSVGVPWEEVSYPVRHTVLTSALAAYPVLYRFPNNWLAEALMKKVCRNKRDTNANKRGRLRENATSNAAPIEDDKEVNEEVNDQPRVNPTFNVEEDMEPVDDTPTDDEEAYWDDGEAELKEPTSNPKVPEDEEPTSNDEPDKDAESQGIPVEEADDEPSTQPVVDDQEPLSSEDEEKIEVPLSTRKNTRTRKARPQIKDSDSEEDLTTKPAKQPTASKAITSAGLTVRTHAPSSKFSTSSFAPSSASDISRSFSKTPATSPLPLSCPNSLDASVASSKASSTSSILPATSSSKATASKARNSVSKQPRAVDKATSIMTKGLDPGQVATAPSNHKRKAKADLGPQPLVDNPPSKRQRPNNQVKRKGKAPNRSDSWARSCQEEVEQLESATVNKATTKEQPRASRPSNSATSAASSSNQVLAPAPTPAPRARARPFPRPPRPDAPSAITLEVKQEMVDEFDLSRSSNRRSTRSAAKKK
ncbi:hypothetical protein BN14_05214 [Rhizoctonia solani AG-1 IB]|uniref:Uncharacterized protein n=1 Tax=Thanatephorus cucumeris (strain AG1-IB / isolate 7/3/14) TaxID=1108050 RepID=M5BVI0_THACB|nr:hypothetical protein BN14_05214 [Rhizoctonia solani AG-1 IB]